MSFNKLTPAQGELLALLMEECGEAIQAAGKILRHGYESQHPCAKDDADNRDDLGREIGNILAAVDLLCAQRDLDYSQIESARKAKLESVGRYLHHATAPPPAPRCKCAICSPDAAGV